VILPVREALADIEVNSGGQMVATADTNGLIRVWNISGRPRLLMSLKDKHTSIKFITLSPSGTMIAQADTDGRVVLWNLSNHRMSLGPKVGTGGLSDLTFNPDGSELAVGDGKGDLILWNVANNSKISEPAIGPPFSNDTIQSVAFSPQGNALAVIDGGDLYLSDSETPRSLGGALSVSSAGYADATFSPDGGTLFVADSNAQVSFWDVASDQQTSDQQIGQIDASNNALGPSIANPLTVSPDGQTLAVRGNLYGLFRDVTTLYPSTDWGDVSAIPELCRELGESLSRSQWTQYVPGEPYQRECPPTQR
jgi:WD40 repeat protein